MWSGLNKDKEFLKHIIEETDFLLKNCGSVEIQDLMADEVRKRACLKSLEIIGETAKNLSEDLKILHPVVEWKRMTGMRNKPVIITLAWIGR